MAPRTRQDSQAWELARWQEWVVTRQQLLDLGLTPDGIRHRVEKGRLWRVHRDVYAVGRPALIRHSAVRACART